MTNTTKTYPDEYKLNNDDCVEGDTVSEGDTSDEEDVEASKNSRITRKTSSPIKEGLELPSGNADRSVTSRANRRKRACVGFVIAALVVASGAIGTCIYFVTKAEPKVPSTTLEGDFATSSSIPATSTTETDVDTQVVSSTTEDEKENNLGLLEVDIGAEAISSKIENDKEDVSKTDVDTDAVSLKIETESGIIGDEPETNSIPRDDTIGLSEETDEDTKPESEDVEVDKEGEEKEVESKPTKWPELLGMTSNEAKAQLEQMYGEGAYDIHILHENDPTTRDFRFNRIRIFQNDDGIVTKVPRIG